ncbi:choline transporter, partial [Nannochloropsis oceanica]
HYVLGLHLLRCLDRCRAGGDEDARRKSARRPGQRPQVPRRLPHLVGFFVTDVMMNVVSAAVAAILVCFLEDSQALAITHPDYHSYLSAAWSMRFPDINW